MSKGKDKNDDIRVYKAIIFVLILATLMSFLPMKGVDNIFLDTLLTHIWYLLYYILLLLSIYYGGKILCHLSKINVIQLIIFIVPFIASLVFLMFTIICLLYDFLDIS